MSYLSVEQVLELSRLLRTFFSLPYSTDLDGKDAETLLRIVKGATGPRSRRKELFDIIDGTIGYSVKTLFKSPVSLRVDLQEQRFCDVEEVRRMRTAGGDNAQAQGRILLNYMYERIREQMQTRGIKTARSLILLKHWDPTRTNFDFLYWEEDFLGFVENLLARDSAGEIEWIVQDAGLHARDRLRLAPKRGRLLGEPEEVRLLRMHYKHNQIFTDHDIPADATRISFTARPFSWDEVAAMIAAHPSANEDLRSLLS
ncbi:hypothetical protein E4L96_19720 [Massilia arenosa]|uniref:Uncharacterized protein n=1 Tax=Zemynaea arenosa TaxID=2561931 RepID=A0A4Y9RWR8_9BURK|nr:hypothetical protein [Massilia arenosa]TFW13333.1 hypothetical protein E4L96_19720 [Massilia arenosa]